MIPLRSAHIVQADPGSVERVLWSTEIWSRSWAGSRLALAVRADESNRAFRADESNAQPNTAAVDRSDRLAVGDTLTLTGRRRSTGQSRRGPGRPHDLGSFRIDGPTGDARRDGAGADGPILVGIAGALRGWRIRTSVAVTGGGCLVTVEATNPGRRWRPGLRSRVLRFQHLFLGLVALLSRADPEPPVVVVAGVIIEQGRVLAARRRYPPELAGLWECPGGKVEPGESEPAALARELQEEIGVQVTVGDRFGPTIRISPTLVLHAYLARITAGRPAPLDHDAVAWVSAEEFQNVEWLPGDAPLMEAVHRLIESSIGTNGTADAAAGLSTPPFG